MSFASLLKLKLSKVFQRRTDPHQIAHDFWKGCSCTFLAGDPTYYDRQELALRSLLGEIETNGKIGLDIGCGNGRFSFLLGEFLQNVTAFDLSRMLIDEAQLTAKQRNVGNVRFEKRDLEDGLPKGQFDVVTCMGVTSTIINEDAYEDLIRQIAKSVKDGGIVITKDSLSVSHGDKPILSGPYVTIYRDVGRYEKLISESGMKLLKKEKLAEAEGLANYLYLWSKT